MAARRSSWTTALEGQMLHLGVLLPGAIASLWLAHGDEEAVVRANQRCVLATVLHQVGTTLLWRAELHAGGLTTRLCRGNRWVAARLTAFFDTSSFSVALRSFVSVALADRHSLFVPDWTAILLAVPLAVLAVYALASALLLLGPMAISGSDHFLPAPGDPLPALVSTHAYALCDHPLFYFGLLLLWAIAVACGSGAALRLAAYLHVAALAFLFGTEIPDMRRIYGRKSHDRSD